MPNNMRITKMPTSTDILFASTILAILSYMSSYRDESSLKVRLCGQVTKEYLPEIERLLAENRIDFAAESLELVNVTFVDREAMGFLCSAKRGNITSEDCHSYVTRWVH